METKSSRSLRSTLALLGLGGWMILALAGQIAFPLGKEPPASLGVDLDAIRSVFAQGQILLTALVLWILMPRGGTNFLVSLLAVFSASWGIEALGVQTGFPFGAYTYSDGLGRFLPGSVPWSIPLSWAVSAVVVHAFLRRVSPESGIPRRILAGSLLLLAWDLVLDPAMSSLLPLWKWEVHGFWYGVPLSNLVGWYVSGAFFLGLLEFRLLPRERLPQAGYLGAFLLSILALPMAMVTLAGYWMAIVASVLVAAVGLLLAGRGATVEEERGVPPRTEDRLAFMARHSRSFRFASRFLSPRLREIVGGVYCWCRVTDDLVDEAVGLSPTQVGDRLDGWEALSRRAYEGQSTGISLLDDVFGSMAARGIPFQVAADLVQGMRMDLEPRHFETSEDLRLYSYRVASTVGIWVTRSAGVDDPCVLECAEALGHAMQLTNILRDVGEDLSRGRVYIPLADLREAGLAPEDLSAYADGSRSIDGNWRGLVESLMARADSDYRLALAGMPYLPGSLRMAVAVASEVYRGIHGAIRRNGYDNFRMRAATGPLEKVFLAAKGGWKSLRHQEKALVVPGVVGEVP